MIRIILAVIVVCSVAAFLVFHRPLHEGSLIKPVTNLTAWQWKQYTSANGSINLDGDALRCDILNVGESASQLVLYQSIPSLRDGQNYRLTFNAKADKNLPIIAAASLGWKDFHSVGLYKQVALTQEWKKYELPFKGERTDGHEVHAPIFLMGLSTGTIWLKDVVLEETR
jgi:hypothetical protein